VIFRGIFQRNNERGLSSSRASSRRFNPRLAISSRHFCPFQSYSGSIRNCEGGNVRAAGSHFSVERSLPVLCVGHSFLSAAVSADSRNLRCIHSRSEPRAKTQPLTTDKFISTNPSPDTGLSEAGNPAFPHSEKRTSRGLVPGAVIRASVAVAAVRLESHDEATDKQNASQDHEHGRTRVGGAPLIETCSRHSEQPRHNAKPTRECYEYRPVMRPAIVRPDDSESATSNKTPERYTRGGIRAS
jgi:hypothetical protein